MTDANKPHSNKSVSKELDYTPNQLDKLDVLRVPYFHPIGFDVGLNSYEINVVCRTSFAISDNGEVVSYSRAEPECVLKLNPASAKDLAQHLFNAVKKFEAKYGEIKTDRMAARAAARNAERSNSDE